MNKYLKEYKWSNIGAMLANNEVAPKPCTTDMSGRLVVVSGATSGIGYCTVRRYAAHGANILCINRNVEKSKALCAEIRDQFNVSCDYMIADYSRISDIHRVAEEIKTADLDIDVFIHNAGVFSTRRIITDDGHELVFQVNYLGSFVLNHILRDQLKERSKARIIFVNSEAHRFAVTGLRLDDLTWKRRLYTGLRSYGAAKMAQLLSMIVLSRYFEGSGVTVNAMHPGNVKTSMGENNGKLYRFTKHLFVDRSAKSAELSADALFYLGASEEVDGVSNRFYSFTSVEEPAPPALDAEAAEELWNVSLDLAGLR